MFQEHQLLEARCRHHVARSAGQQAEHVPHERRIVRQRRRQTFPRVSSWRQKTVGEMRWQLGRDHAGPQSVGLQTPPQRFVEHLLIGQVPEFVAEHGILRLVTDKDEFQRNRLGRGPRSVGSHGCHRL